jgi:hypothetical protein
MCCEATGAELLVTEFAAAFDPDLGIFTTEYVQ